MQKPIYKCIESDIIELTKQINKLNVQEDKEMTKMNRIDYIEQQTNRKVIDTEVEGNVIIYWSEDGVIAKYNMRTNNLTIMDWAIAK